MSDYNPLDTDAMQESDQKAIFVAIKLREAGQLSLNGKYWHQHLLLQCLYRHHGDAAAVSAQSVG